MKTHSRALQGVSGAFNLPSCPWALCSYSFESSTVGAQGIRRRVKLLFVGPFHIKMPIARLPAIAWRFQSFLPSDWNAIHLRTGRMLAVHGVDRTSSGTAAVFSCTLLQVQPVSSCCSNLSAAVLPFLPSLLFESLFHLV